MGYHLMQQQTRSARDLAIKVYYKKGDFGSRGQLRYTGNGLRMTKHTQSLGTAMYKVPSSTADRTGRKSPRLNGKAVQPAPDHKHRRKSRAELRPVGKYHSSI